ncbi:MAG: 4-hydroxy-tetrahydrodipicolinate reductase [Clostridia bacterium]|nr:4-hydroxy-tetrahydrodipicolinate reductase [Clostridia bacterium]
MTKIILSGCAGHMGRVITALANGRDDVEIVAGIDLNTEAGLGYPIYKNITEVNEKADAVIDFSHVSVLESILAYGAEHTDTALVLCTTGYSPEQVEAVKKASETSPVFYSRNMSLGINLIIELAKKATAVLGDQFDIEIIEKHHNQKIDAPSGTALMIADAIADVREGESVYTYDRHAVRKKREKSEIGISAVRGGTIVGEHEVIFAGNNEVITLSHSAQSKDLFASGAVNAAVFMTGKPAGLYDMSAMI